jgi:hypothetical protein
MAGSVFNMLGQGEDIPESTSAFIGNGIGGLATGEGRYGIAEDAEQALGPVRLDGGFQTRQLSAGGSGGSGGAGQQEGAQVGRAGAQQAGQAPTGSGGTSSSRQGATGINAGDSQTQEGARANQPGGNSTAGYVLDKPQPPGPTPYERLLKRRQSDQEITGDRDPTGGGTADLTKPYDPESDAVRGKNWQYLTYEQKERFKQHFTPEELSRINLDDVKLHDDDRRWYMPGKMNGMVLDNHIYITPEVLVEDKLSRFDPAVNPGHFGLLAHEVAHVGQFQNGMTRPGYLFQGLINGYRDNPFEREARSHERARLTESNIDR